MAAAAYLIHACSICLDAYDGAKLGELLSDVAWGVLPNCLRWRNYTIDHLQCLPGSALQRLAGPVLWEEVRALEGEMGGSECLAGA